MNEGIHLDLDTWIVPGQIRKANHYSISTIYHNMHPLLKHLPKYVYYYVKGYSLQSKHTSATLCMLKMPGIPASPHAWYPCLPS